MYFGGPVQVDRGFVLHRPLGDWQSTLSINAQIGLTTSRDILQAVGEGRGPEQILVSLGYAGWAPGQLEQELTQNAWLTVGADLDVIFELPRRAAACPLPWICWESTWPACRMTSVMRDAERAAASAERRVTTAALRPVSPRERSAARPVRHRAGVRFRRAAHRRRGGRAVDSASPIRWRRSAPVPTHARFEHIERLIQEWRPVLLVVGLPSHMDGTRARAVARAAGSFAQQLAARASGSRRAWSTSG